MKLWFYALAAHNEQQWGEQPNLQIGYFEAETYAEAKQKVVELLIETFPVSDGWNRKSMNLNSIPKTALMSVLGVGYEDLPVKHNPD